MTKSGAIPYRAAIFDFGGVMTMTVAEARRQLAPEDAAAARLVLDEFRRAYGRLDEEPEHEIHLMETGRLSEAEFYRRMAKRLRAAGHGEVDVRVIRKPLIESATINPRMVDLVRRLRQRVKTAVLSNTVAEWMGERWRQTATPELFDVIVQSHLLGLRKPDPRVFEHVCALLEVAPREAVFVDDIGVNVKAARALGLQTILFRDPDVAIREIERLFGLETAR